MRWNKNINPFTWPNFISVSWKESVMGWVKYVLQSGSIWRVWNNEKKNILFKIKEDLFQHFFLSLMKIGSTMYYFSEWVTNMSARATCFQLSVVYTWFSYKHYQKFANDWKHTMRFWSWLHRASFMSALPLIFSSCCRCLQCAYQE